MVHDCCNCLGAHQKVVFMNRKDIICMAREAGAMFEHIGWLERDLEPVFQRFANLVAAAEREACAKICRSEADRALFNFQNDLPQNESFWNGAEQMASSCENLIKARGKV
jgi:hypothetical protein